MKNTHSDKLNVLLCCNRPTQVENAATIIDHIDAFGKYSRHNILMWSSLNGLPNDEVLKKIDCIVIHYTLSLLNDSYIPFESLERIRTFPGLKICFLQDEYRRVNIACEKIKHAKFDALFTCAPIGVREKIYASIEGEIDLHTTLTGYVPEHLVDIKTKPIEERSIDVSYRARKCSYALGHMSHDKYLIGSLFEKFTRNAGLKCDISSKERNRLYGKDWVDFTSESKATLGTESGASLIDFTGEAEYKINRYQAYHPFCKFNDIPPYLLEDDGKIELQVISPRCFEAAALKTVMIMYPGCYSGILTSGRHYIPLKKDFSNIDEVLGRLRDTTFLEQIAQNARHDLVDSGNYSYRKFVLDFDASVEKLAIKKQWIPLKETIASESLARATPQYEHKGKISNGLLLRLKNLTTKYAPNWLIHLLCVTIYKKKIYPYLDDLDKNSLHITK